MINGGRGDDRLIYKVSAGKDKATIRGGMGNDTLLLEVGKKQNVTVLNKNGKIIFKRGNGGTVVKVDGIENFKVNGKKIR